MRTLVGMKTTKQLLTDDYSHVQNNACQTEQLKLQLYDNYIFEC